MYRVYGTVLRYVLLSLFDVEVVIRRYHCITEYSTMTYACVRYLFII